VWRPNTFSRAVADLADGCTRPGGVDDQLEEVLVESGRPSSLDRVGRRLGEATERLGDLGVVALGPQLLELGELLARTEELSTLSTSICSFWSGRNLLTPITGWRPESIRAWVRAAASSMRSLGIPASIAAVMPPASRPPGCAPSGFDELVGEPLDVVANRPTDRSRGVVPDSCWRKSWVLRAMRALKSVGSASASSSALVCSDWVCPWVAAIASTQVRTTLL
jgi:hypothetical protein